MSGQQRRAVAHAAWRLTVLSVLTLAVAWDAVGLLAGGDAAYVSPSYDVLRRLVPGGMRSYGYALACLLVVTVYAYGRHGPGCGVRGYRLLRVSLALVSAWYVLWAVGIAGAWVIHGQILAWGALGKLALVAVLCVVLARTTPADQ
ncbi:hypothetical protein AB0O64_37970 [Streptomyces sp. NPDC088341]|uniref:hypothetical protein n=1 Tax=Streptomyces sp. NPDC088341 TaxID=3154870 RepID=UPI0034311630